MRSQTPDQSSDYVPKLRLDDLGGETMHTKLDEAKDRLHDFTISCSEKGIDGVENRCEAL